MTAILIQIDKGGEVMTIKERVRIIGTMVWCQSCETVVWAHDSNQGDLRGILNMLKIPCRLCGKQGNFNGYSANTAHMEAHDTFDGWSTMKALAEYEKVKWNPSPDNRWR